MKAIQVGSGDFGRLSSVDSIGDCPVCLDPVVGGNENVIQCPNCFKFCHLPCAAGWVVTRGNCPACKQAWFNEAPNFSQTQQVSLDLAVQALQCGALTSATDCIKHVNDLMVGVASTKLLYMRKTEHVDHRVEYVQQGPDVMHTMVGKYAPSSGGKLYVLAHGDIGPSYSNAMVCTNMCCVDTGGLACVLRDSPAEQVAIGQYTCVDNVIPFQLVYNRQSADELIKNLVDAHTVIMFDLCAGLLDKVKEISGIKRIIVCGDALPENIRHFGMVHGSKELVVEQCVEGPDGRLRFLSEYRRRGGSKQIIDFIALRPQSDRNQILDVEPHIWTIEDGKMVIRSVSLCVVGCDDPQELRRNAMYSDVNGGVDIVSAPTLAELLDVELFGIEQVDYWKRIQLDDHMGQYVEYEDHSVKGPVDQEIKVEAGQFQIVDVHPLDCGMVAIQIKSRPCKSADRSSAGTATMCSDELLGGVLSQLSSENKYVEELPPHEFMGMVHEHIESVRLPAPDHHSDRSKSTASIFSLRGDHQFSHRILMYGDDVIAVVDSDYAVALMAQKQFGEQYRFWARYKQYVVHRVDMPIPIVPDGFVEIRNLVVWDCNRVAISCSRSRKGETHEDWTLSNIDDSVSFPVSVEHGPELSWVTFQPQHAWFVISAVFGYGGSAFWRQKVKYMCEGRNMDAPPQCNHDVSFFRVERFGGIARLYCSPDVTAEQLLKFSRDMSTAWDAFSASESQSCSIFPVPDEGWDTFWEKMSVGRRGVVEMVLADGSVQELKDPVPPNVMMFRVPTAFENIGFLTKNESILQRAWELIGAPPAEKRRRV